MRVQTAFLSFISNFRMGGIEEEATITDKEEETTITDKEADNEGHTMDKGGLLRGTKAHLEEAIMTEEEAIKTE